MKRQGFGLSSEGGIDIYSKNEGEESFDHFWAPSADDVTLPREMLISESELSQYLDVNQCFETQTHVYFKTEDGLQKYSKRECCEDAVNCIVDCADAILCVEHFVKMSPQRRSCLAEILYTVFSDSSGFGDSVVLPVVSDIDYLSVDYYPEEFRRKIEIPTSSEPWKEALAKIRTVSSLPVDMRFSYTHLCRKVLFR